MLICLRARSYDEWHLILFCVKLRGCSWRGDLGILLLLLLILMLMLMLSCGRMMIVRPFFGPTLKPLSAWFLVLWGRFVGPHVLQDQSEFESGSEYAPGFEMYLYLRCHDLALECHSTPCWLRLIKVGSCQLARRVDWSLSRCLHFIFFPFSIFSLVCPMSDGSIEGPHGQLPEIWSKPVAADSRASLDDLFVSDRLICRWQIAGPPRSWSIWPAARHTCDLAIRKALFPGGWSFPVASVH